MAEDVPEGFTSAFSQLKKMHDELHTNMTLQTTIIQGLIVKAHQHELAIARQTLQVPRSNCSKTPNPGIDEAPDECGDVAHERKDNDANLFEEIPILSCEKESWNGLTDAGIVLQPKDEAIRKSISFGRRLTRSSSCASRLGFMEDEIVKLHQEPASDTLATAGHSSTTQTTARPSSVSIFDLADRSVDISRSGRVLDQNRHSRHSTSTQLRMSLSSKHEGQRRLPASARWEALMQKVILHWLSGRKMTILHLRPIWAKEITLNWSLLAGKVDSAANRTDSGVTSEVTAGSQVSGRSKIQRFVIHPDSMISKLILIFGSIALVYDLVTVPYMLAFDIDSRGALMVVNSSVTVFWTLDMLASSLTGYYAKNLIEMRPSMCFINYLKTWGVLDAAINLSDWISLTLYVVHSGSGEANHVLSGSRLLKYYRFLRVLRMFRLFKLMKAMSSYLDGMATEMMMVFTKLITTFLIIFVLNHYIACFWAALAKSNSTDEKTWLGQLQMDNSSNEYQYVVAIHWAMTQFTPATNNVNPMNLRERVFAFFVVFFALVMFSSFLSGIARAVDDIKKMQIERYEEEAKIRRFIFERRVSLHCARRIWNFYRTYYKSAPVTMCFNDVAFLAKMPKTIRMALHQDCSLPILGMHPLFHHISALDAPALLQVCDKGLTETAYQTQQEVFHVDDRADFVYFLHSGALSYEYEQCVYPDPYSAPQVFSEAALWAQWFHSGTGTTTVKSHILSLNVDTFTRMMESHAQGPMLCGVKSYARSFVDNANAGIDEKSITDAPPETDEAIEAYVYAAFHPYLERQSTASIVSGTCSHRAEGPISRGFAQLTSMVKARSMEW